MAHASAKPGAVDERNLGAPTRGDKKLSRWYREPATAGERNHR